ncbi:MAG TPA: DUF2950 domain-containing protein [Burkholderiaceae bacterium]|nr:DUF2950 domain-containing protein [Burkholderiaceae bacterium]
MRSPHTPAPTHLRLRRRWLVLGTGIAAACVSVAVVRTGMAGEPAQRQFATAQQAADALVAAVRSNDQNETIRILGPEGEKLVHSGDKVADQESRTRFVKAYDTAHRIDVEGGAAATLVVGSEHWSLPIPIVKQADRWHFDTTASVQKIIDRRVGRNELSVIEVCRAYVAAQREYASQSRPGGAAHEYARRFHSEPGTHDGLYWEPAAGEAQSPLGPLIASAQAEGYEGDQPTLYHSPYHGYLYRILTRQGAHAPGGAKDYIVNGHMTAGFALVAYPARWGDSGIMTFMVNQEGVVFEKNLGPQTQQAARAITEFDPDSSWNAP